MADTKLKVTFIDIIVTRDGDPLNRGQVYWSFKVDGSVVTSRSVANPLTIGSGGTITLGASSTVTKSGTVGTNIVVSGQDTRRRTAASAGRTTRTPSATATLRGSNWGTR